MSDRSFRAGCAGKFSSAFILRGRVSPARIHGVLAPLPLDAVAAAGDLRRRQTLNFQRLHEAPYRFAAMIDSSTSREAPGDWVGRAVLALSVLGQTLHTEPHYLEEIIARLPSALNERGYIGLVHAPGTADENQVGGHNGLLRGLCEYYLWKKDPRALALIRSVVTGLMLPTRPLYAEYPSERLEKLADGKPVGLTVKHEGAWVGLSTDIGVVFFTLDGLTQAYTIDPTPELRALIETMIARYAQIDVVALSAQTHSTLSTLRGIFRWWEEVDPRPELLALVRERYALYGAHAETEHYANYNWFGRPEWTEACGVVDSFLLALQLWRATAQPDYLRTAHRIYFNSLSYAQRPNGGFGCDQCVGANGRLHVEPHPKIFEAPFCCSMRGAEGLAWAAQGNFMVEAARGEVWTGFYFEGDYTLRFADGEVVLRVVSEYPHAGRVRWTVARASAVAPKRWHFFVPPNVPARALRLTRQPKASVGEADAPEVALTPVNGFVAAEVSFVAGESFALEFPLSLATYQPHTTEFPAGYHRFFHGPLLLGAEQRDPATATLQANDEFTALGRGRYQCKRTGTELAPINDLTYRDEAEARRDRRQVLFPE